MRAPTIVSEPCTVERAIGTESSHEHKLEVWNTLSPQMRSDLRALLGDPMLQSGGRPVGIAIFRGGECIYSQLPPGEHPKPLDRESRGIEYQPPFSDGWLLRRQAL